MRCPACKGAAKDLQEVHKTVDTGAANVRFRRCQCGATWTTMERIERGSLVTIKQVTGDPLVTLKSVTGDLSVTLKGRGFSGSGIGSGSDLDPSGSLEASGSEVLRKIRKVRKIAPSLPGFDAFYAEYPRKVARPHALAMWRREGCEDVAAGVLAGLRLHLPELAAREADKVPYPATFITRRRWEDPPMAIARPIANGSATGPSGDLRRLRCDDHLDGNPVLFSHRPLASCPECKHLRAKYPKHPRVVSMDELFAKG